MRKLLDGLRNGYKRTPTQKLASAGRPAIEALEGRTLMSVSALSITTLSTNGGVELHVQGNKGNDTINVTMTSRGLAISNNGKLAGVYGGNYQTLTIDGGAGNDKIALDASVTTDAVLYGGAGNDTLSAGSGNDRLYGGLGTNTLIAGSGDDTLVTIGSTADTLVGGSGNSSFWTDANSRERITNLRSSEAGNVHRVSSFFTSSSSNVSSGKKAQGKKAKGGKKAKAVPQTLLGQSMNEPSLTGSFTYHNFSADPLFSSNGPSENDVNQGQLGDCYFLATLASIAKTDPSLIRQSMVDLGDGTYAVQFSRGNTSVFVRVDAQLPTTRSGQLAYAGLGADNSLWVAIMEKAFAYYRTGSASYGSIESGWMDEAYSDLGRASQSAYGAANGAALLSAIQAQLGQGKSVTMAIGNAVAGSNLVGDHAYTVDHVNFDNNGIPTSVTLRNPWGMDNYSSADGANDGYVTVSGEQALKSMMGFAWAAV